MLNQVKSSFTVTTPRSEAKALVEAFARQEKPRLYPFELQNFTLGVRFQNADPQTQRVIVMTMLSWLDQHSLKSQGGQDQQAWQMGWKMREAFLHMLKFNIPFHEQDVIAMLGWSASQASTSVYVYFSGVPQIIKVVRDYLKSNPMSDELQEAIQTLTLSLESQSMSVEIRRWIMQIKEVMGETQVSLPFVAGDSWSDAALKELYALPSRTKKAWAELLTYCSSATGSSPTKKWLKEADQYIDALGSFHLFLKLLHWFPLVDKSRPTSAHRRSQSLLPANAKILKGLIWLCGKADDVEIARALASLALSDYRKSPASGRGAGKIADACLWALRHMHCAEAKMQLDMLKEMLEAEPEQKRVASAPKMTAG